MVRTISDDALDVIGTGATYTTALTITAPGNDPQSVELSPGWSVTERSVIAGTRLSVASLRLMPSDGVDDMFELAGWPGAEYDISIGIDLNSAVEEIPVFHGHGQEGSNRRLSLGVAASLTDPWMWVDGVAFGTPLATLALVDRSIQIATIFTDVLSDNLQVITTADGGDVCQPGVYTVSRGQAALQLAQDGLLQVGFNAVGQLIIKAQPSLGSDLTPDWLFRTDQDTGLNVAAAPVAPATIIDGTLERTRPWTESIVNRVNVIPGAEWQTWKAQTARLAAESDPRHEDYVGVREVTITSNTIANAYDAYRLALYELTRRLRTMHERVRFSVLLNPAIEADDIVYVSAMPTLDDRGWNGTYIATAVTHAPSQGITTIEAISASGFNLGT